ncbi:thiamine pyrophosphate-binding protein [Halobacteriales archaeon Cl-PHB]
MTGDYSGADLFVDALADYGVNHVFGNPGTTELPVLDAIADSDLDYVLGLHEDVAVGMAAGYASTRRYHSHHDADVLPLGVANLHITPGLAHGLGNVYAASVAGAPLLVTAGNHERDFRHEEPILSGDLEAMVDQFTKWSAEVLDVEALPTMLRRACRVALTPPTGPVFLALPQDVMLDPVDPEAIEPLGPIPDAGGGDPAQVARAADLLVDADDPVLVLGDGVARAGAVDEAVAVAEAVGARVHAEILACEVNFPGDHPQWVSHIPPDESMASMLMGGDTVVFVGCSTNTTLMAHEAPLVDPDSTTIHVSQDAWQVGKNQHADAAVVGDPGHVLARLADRLDERLPADERQRRVDHVGAIGDSLADTIWALSEDEPGEGETRPSKAALVDALREVATDAFVVDEGVTAKYPLLIRWAMDAEQLLSNKGGGLGYGLPAAVGAALAESLRPDPRTVVGYVGDGSYLYYPHAVYSAVRADLDLTVVVPDNRNYRILKDNTQAIFGGTDADHDYVGMDFEPAVDLVTNAESHGARGHRVETPEALEPTLEAALEADGVDVVDVLVHD